MPVSLPLATSAPPTAILYSEIEPPAPELVTYKKLPEGSVATFCGALPAPSLTEPSVVSRPLPGLTANSRTSASPALTTYRKAFDGVSASPVGPAAAPTAVVPSRVSVPLAVSRLNSLSIPSALLVANSSPAPGCGVGPPVGVGVTSKPVRKARLPQEAAASSRRAPSHPAAAAHPASLAVARRRDRPLPPAEAIVLRTG